MDGAATSRGKLNPAVQTEDIDGLINRNCELFLT